MTLAEPGFYLLDTQDAEFPCRWLQDEAYIKGVSFEMGRLVSDPIPQPLEYTLEPLDEHDRDNGPEMPAYFDANYPLFRDDLLAAMREFGVRNLETFEATIFDPDNDDTHANYKAVNVVGLVKAADMSKSIAAVYDGVPSIDVSFDKLVLDEKSDASKFMIFRLAEKSTALLVRRDLKEFLEGRGFDHICFGDLRNSAL